MAKLINPTYFIGGNEIASNSLDVDYGDPISIKAGYATKAVAGDKIDGVSVETKTFDSDNTSVETAKIEFARMGDESIVEFTVEGWTIVQWNVGSIYDLNSSSNVNGATIAPVAQVDTITLTGTDGTATISGAGAITAVATFNSTLTQTTADYVTANASAYLAQGITLTSSVADLIFTATIAWDSFTSPAIANLADSLDGTVDPTTANVSAPTQLILRKVKSTTLGDFVRAK